MASSQKTERKNYSKLTAQVAKNTVKRRILEIRSGGAGKADVFLNEMLEKNKIRNRNSIEKNCEVDIDGMIDGLKQIVEKNRTAWRNFLIEMSVRYDPDRISHFGVGLIYGGIMTSSVGNKGWVSIINLDKIENSEDAKAAKLREIISQGRRRGNLVWIIKGRKAISAELLKICRYEPECTFIICVPHKNERNGEISDLLSDLRRSVNATPMISELNDPLISEFDKNGILYLIGDIRREVRGTGKGSEHLTAALPTRLEQIPALASFLQHPSLPLKIGHCYGFLSALERLLSDGKSTVLPEYDI